MKLRKMNRESRNLLARAEKGNTSGIRPSSPLFMYDGGTITKRERNQSWHYDNCYGGCGMTRRASAHLRKRGDSNRLMVREMREEMI